MNQVSNPLMENSEILKLKIAEPEVSKEDPWVDDALGRKQLADRLTNLVRDQSAPFTVSIHGSWGTGKTFLLKRWQRDLEVANFRAIYFNAWEDDFCDDALVAILGQLSDYFSDDSFTGIVKEMGKVTLHLMEQNAISIVENKLGVTVIPEQGSEPGQDPLESYRSQIRAKTELRGHLGKLSNQVREETGHPLIFIIDELDRCRPTFAIDVLEKVKHIFDVPNVVFVFGMNRDELCSSLRSVYGDIDATVYLRKFFDMEFNLPEADVGHFCRFSIRRYGLRRFFNEIKQKHDYRWHGLEYQDLEVVFPMLLSQWGLSLRDIDHCVKTLVLVERNLTPEDYMYPLLLSLLVLLKLVNPRLYQEYISGKRLGGNVMNYLDENIPTTSLSLDAANAFNLLEAELYCADRIGNDGDIPALEQLNLLLMTPPISPQVLSHPEYLSDRTKNSDTSRITRIVQHLGNLRTVPISNEVPARIAKWIDLHQADLRR
ncbi:MAG: AAA family ATPase [Chloroflexi bacterium]|nr:AAA family ATPase [Chloroflexota bacterium]